MTTLAKEKVKEEETSKRYDHTNHFFNLNSTFILYTQRCRREASWPLTKGIIGISDVACVIDSSSELSFA